MATKSFNTQEWNKILKLAKRSAHRFGLPRRRRKSVVLGTFNIRKLGVVKNKSPKAWEFLEMTCKRFDLLAIQEVMDNLEGIVELKKRMGRSYGMVVSDVTGVFPGDRGNPERLAFLFRWNRVARTELASDITYDRSKVVSTLFENRDAFSSAWNEYSKKLAEWEKKVRKTKPTLRLPTFLTFIRQPHFASFKIPGKNRADPYQFLVVNAHLLYGDNPRERKWEFDALIEWLVIRAKQSSRMYYKNILMMGDCNLEFKNADIKREAIDAFLMSINKRKLKSKKAAKVNFPLLTPHPKHGELRTSILQKDAYDQIALFTHDDRLPTYKANAIAGSTADAYDYGVFNFTDLFAQALFDKPYGSLPTSDQRYIIKRSEYDVSDHMPTWIRLPIPGA